MEKLKNIPSLRFLCFLDEWAITNVGKLGTFVGGGTPSSKNIDYWKGDIPWISSSDLSEDSIYNIRITRHITEAAIAESATKLIPSKSILIVSRVGVGKVAVNEEELCTSQDFCSIIPFNDDYIFLAYLIKIKTNKLLDFNQGTSIKGFVKSDLVNLVISIPSLSEQQKIASFLTAVDKKIQLLNKKKNLLEQYKKGVMQQIFNLQIRFKDDDGNDYPDWEDKILRDLVTIRYGKDQKQVIVEHGLYPILGTGGEIGRTNNFLYDRPSVLIGRKGTIDKPKYLEKPFWTVDTLFYTEIFNSTYPKWLYFKFDTINWYLYNEASGVPSLSASTIYKIKIKLPCLDEQTKIANFLSSIDNKINLVNQQITLTQQYKKGLLQQMFV